jgi:hypothetical protein
MSVTFTTEMSPITGFTLDCGVHDNGTTEHRFGNYSDAEAFLQGELDAHGCTGHLAVCGDDFCESSRMFIHATEEAPAPQVNVSNDNAKHLLALLGSTVEYGGEMCGGMSGEDFLGRVLMAIAVAPSDAGVPSYENRSEGGMTMVMCGRRAGYTEGRLEELRELAEFSVATGRPIQWA